MSLQSLSLVLVVVVGWASLVVLGQSVVARSGSDDESGFAEPEGGSDGQSRTLYSHPKHLSPHKMMHFGKRLLVQQAPGIYTTTTNQVLDLYHRRPSDQQVQQQQQQQQQQQFDEQQQQELQPAGFPYTLYRFSMPRDRVVESVQSDPIGMARNRQMMNVVQNLLARQQQLAGCDDNSNGPQQQQQQHQQQQFRRQQTNLAPQQKLLRLVKSDGSDSSESASSSSSSSGNNENTQGAGQQEQHDSNGSNTSNGRAEGDEIDRSSRSVGPSRPLLPGLTRAQFSMLFGGQPSSGSQASLLNFIKKAEPQRMTFMHFGRRR